MADLTDETTQKVLRAIVREEMATGHAALRIELRAELGADLRADMRQIVREETADIRTSLTDLQKTLEEETTDIRADIKTIKDVQGQQGIVLRAMRTDLSGLKTAYRAQAKDVHKLGVLFEDLDYRFQAAAELD